MSELHFVGAAANDENIEAVHPEFVREGLLWARDRSWAAFSEIRNHIQEGMTEVEAREMATKTLADLGATRHWHSPYVRIGPGTSLTFHESLRKDYRLKEGDPVYLDLGPVWPDPNSSLEYEGDVGDTFAFGENPEVEDCAKCARELWHEGRQLWSEEKATGQRIYEYLKDRATSRGWILVENVTGHRLSDFPHTKYAKERLDKIPFNPTTSLWILELQINHPESSFGAFFEDLLF